MACCPRASSFVPHGASFKPLGQGALILDLREAPRELFAACDGSPMTVRGGGVPARTTALMPVCRMGPPPWSSLELEIIGWARGAALTKITPYKVQHEEPPRAPTTGVREAPRHEIAGDGSAAVQRLWGISLERHGHGGRSCAEQLAGADWWESRRGVWRAGKRVETKVDKHIRQPNGFDDIRRFQLRAPRLADAGRSPGCTNRSP